MKLLIISLVVCVYLVLSESCIYNGRRYEPGERYKIDPCTDCQCGENNQPICLAVMCNWPKCKNAVRPIVRPRDCCASCPGV